MPKFKFLLLGCLLIFCTLSCEKINFPDPTPFNKVYGGSGADAANGIVRVSDGGYLIAGSTPSNDQDVSGNHGLSDFWVLKVDRNGIKQWQKALGGSAGDVASAVVASSDGGYVIAGYTQSNDGDVTGLHGIKSSDYDVWVVKVDKTGKLLWQRALGGSRIDNALSIVNSPDGGYVIAGYTQSADGDVTKFQGEADAWIIKINDAGTKLWEKTYGGSRADYAYAITAIPSGGYVIAGQTTSNNGDVTGNHGNVDAWLLAIDGSGNKLWQKTYGGSGNDYARSVCISHDGGYAIAGVTTSNDGDVSGFHGGFDDAWVFKTDRNGNMLWQKTLGGSDGETAASITTASYSGYAIAGTTNSKNGDVTFNHGDQDAWLVLLDEKGNLVNQKTIGGSTTDAATSIIAIKDNPFAMQGNYFSVAGYTDSKNGDVSGLHGSVDAWIFNIQLDE